MIRRSVEIKTSLYINFNKNNVVRTEWWLTYCVLFYNVYRNDFSKSKRSLFARYRAPSMFLASNSLERYVDANSGLRRHSFVTFVYFKLYFNSIQITLGTERLINIDKLTFGSANWRFITVTKTDATWPLNNNCKRKECNKQVICCKPVLTYWQ